MREITSELDRAKRGESRDAMRVAANVAANFHGELRDMSSRLHDFYRSDQGLGRTDGLCAGGRPDIDGILIWGIEHYLRQRGAGASVKDAQSSTESAIRATPEWRARHAR
jgi:hypothetical protein